MERPWKDVASLHFGCVYGTCQRPGAETANIPGCTLSENQGGPYVGEEAKKSGRPDICVGSFFGFPVHKGF